MREPLALNCALVYGKRKRGKTTFSMSFPKPMVYFDLEMGAKVIEPRFVLEPEKIKVLEMVEMPKLNVAERRNAAAQFWQEMIKAYLAALEDKAVETIVFDTFTTCWDACRAAYLVELSAEYGKPRVNLQQVEYAEPNRRMKLLITQALIHKKILVLVQHTRPVYETVEDQSGKKTSMATDVEEPDGFKAARDLADVVLNFDKEAPKPGDPKVPVCTIEDCRLSMMAEGMKIAGPTYKKVCDTISAFRNMK